PGHRFPVTVWRDGANQRMRIEVLGGLDTVLSLADVEYSVYPRINVTRCGVYRYRSGSHNDVDSVFPDLAGWEFGGDITLDGEAAQIWQFQHKSGDKVSQYTFYTTASGVPLKFVMLGINYLTDGHFDEYIYTFTHFTTELQWPAPPVSDDRLARAGRQTDVRGDTPFSPPPVCASKPGVSRQSGSPAEVLQARHPVAAQLHALLPRVRGYDLESAYHAFARAAHPSNTIHIPAQGAVHQIAMPFGPGGRAHIAGHEVFASRLARFQSTVQAVQAHNADPSKSYRQKVHAWADWSDEEFLAVMLPNKARKAALANRPQLTRVPDSYTPVGRFEPRLRPSQLPSHVDWRGTGADPGIKDQGMYVSTGQRRSFSEQQIIDCSWDYGPGGCGGGDYQPAFNYVAREGGIALEQDYPYLSNNDYCRARNASRPGQFKGFLEIPSRDEHALMEAVLTLGPIAVAVDAEFESFRAYGEGVYDEARCSSRSADLDHAVLLFGYGTTRDGVDYWLVRNSWAKFYGDDGYVKIKRGRNDCGISTDPVAAVVSDAYVVPGMAQRKQAEAVRFTIAE
ncbi:hypothetical protein QJQ45_024698, partial [Haematococcus lacustris]